MIKKSLVTAVLAAGIFSHSAFAQDTIDPETLFADAMKYREDGEIFRAIELFETILKHQPELNRARLELAVSYHKTRKYAQAQQQLTQVLNDPKTPESVKLSISAYLAQLSSDIKTADQRSTSSIYLSAGAFSDSNINLGPDNFRDFTLDPSSEKQSGSGMQLMLSYAHRSRASQPLNIGQSPVDFEWHSQATAYSKAYGSGDSDFNLGVLSLSTGPALLKNASWRAALNFKLDRIYFGNDPYADQLGLNPVFTYNVSDDLELSLGNTTLVKEHEESLDQGLDGTSRSWDMNVSRFYKTQLIGVQAGIKYHDNGAKNAALHYTGPEIYLGGQIPAWTNARSFLTLSSRSYNYKAADGVVSTSTRRDETELSAVIGISQDFRSGALKSWSLNAQYAYTDNDSNLDEFSYDRGVFELNLRRYFF